MDAHTIKQITAGLFAVVGAIGGVRAVVEARQGKPSDATMTNSLLAVIAGVLIGTS